MDELSPLFHDIEFNERFRGYDVEEVDAYVDRVAKAAALVQGRIAELQDRVAAAEAQPRTVVASTPAGSGEVDDARLSRVLVLAQRTADAAIEEAKAEAESMRIDASADADRIRREANDHASLVLAEAETDRRRMVTEAEEVAAGVLAAERARVGAEVAELEQHRAFLADDIAILEQHLAETRLSVAASVSALTDLLEAPDAFRAPTMPATSGIDVPAGLIEGRPRPAETGPAPIDDLELAVTVDAQPGAVADDDDVPAETPLIDDVALVDSVTEAADPESEATFDPELAGPINLEPSEPTEVFETISFDTATSEVPESPAVDMSIDAMPDIESASTVTGEIVANDDVAPVDATADTSLPPELELSAAAEAPAVVEPVEMVDPDTRTAGSFTDEIIAAAPVEAPSGEPDHADIDLVDSEPVVDLTEPPIDLASDPPDDPRPDAEVNAVVSPETPDGEGATATAPPRLVTAEDIESAVPGEWIDERRDAATDDSGQDLLFAPPEPAANDHFLDQLRDAVDSGEPDEFGEDALAAFFDDGDDEDKGGWFNRRR